MKPGVKLPDPHERAAEFFLRRRSADWSAADESQLQAWLETSEEHRDCFASVEQMWVLSGEAAASDGVRTLRAEALAARPQGDASQTRRWALAASLAVAVLGGTAGALMLGKAQVPDGAAPARIYRTAVGERATIALADGSRLALNTASEVSVDYSGRNRALKLVAGEAWFDVAKDPERPFVVSANGHTVTAIGTSFDVRLEPSGLRVAVAEGRVAVGALGRGHLSDVSAGERMDVAGEAAVVRPSGPIAGDWREGRLEFASVTLSEAVAEMNRYRRKPILVADPAVGRLKISGVFYSGESSGFLDALPLTHPVSVRVGDDAVRIASATDKKTSPSD